VLIRKYSKKEWQTKVKQLLYGNDSTGDDNNDSTGNDEEAICGKEEPSAKATAKDDNADTTDNFVSKAIAALFDNEEPTKDKGGGKE
jgi:hypothetical protein